MLLCDKMRRARLLTRSDNTVATQTPESEIAEFERLVGMLLQASLLDGGRAHVGHYTLMPAGLAERAELGTDPRSLGERVEVCVTFLCVCPTTHTGFCCAC